MEDIKQATVFMFTPTNWEDHLRVKKCTLFSDFVREQVYVICYVTCHYNALVIY